MSKFKPGDELYFVNPHVFIIDKVLIQFVDNNIEVGIMYYIDNSGAYLPEYALTRTLSEAKALAFKLLKDFQELKEHEIRIANPQLYLEEED